jgi:hypothetical protein
MIRIALILSLFLPLAWSAPAQDKVAAAATAFLDQTELFGTVTVEVHGGGSRPQGEGSETFSIQRVSELTFKAVSGPAQVHMREAARKFLEALDDPNVAPQGKKALEAHRKSYEDLANTGLWMADPLKPEGTFKGVVHDSRVTPGGGRSTLDGEPPAENLAPNVILNANTLKGVYSLTVRWKGEIDVVRTSGSAAPAKAREEATPSGFEIKDQPIPGAGGAIAGRRPLNEKELQHFTGNKFGTVQGSVSWSLAPKSLTPVELIVDIPDYQNWLPEPSLTGDQVGSKLLVNVRLQARGGGAPNDQIEALRINLENVSREPGIAGNAPLDPPLIEDWGDLVLRAEDNPGMKITSKGGNHAVAVSSANPARVVIGARDGGAYGILRVDALLKSGRYVDGTLQERPLLRDIPIPRRTLPSKVGDAFRVATSALGDDDSDDETDPPGNPMSKGDGLTLYEEYRGFFQDGKFFRGDPKKKDFFICNLQKDERFKEGIKIFAAASTLAVHSDLKPGEMKDRCINFNQAVGRRVEQHGVIIFGFKTAIVNQGKSTPISKMCMAYTSSTKRDTTPKDYQGVYVAADLEAPEAPAQVIRGGATVTGKDRVAVCLAHELFHTVNVDHHGDADNSQVHWEVSGTLPGGPFTVTETAVVDGVSTTIPVTVLTEAGIPYVFKATGPGAIWLGLPGGLFSGDEACVMRYAWAHAYVDPKDRSARIFVKGDDLQGSGLCTKLTGTDINKLDRTVPRGGSRFGKASVGNCAGQIVVNDLFK